MESDASQTIPAALARQAQLAGELPVFHYLSGETWQAVTRQECWFAAQKLAQVFKTLGLAAGDRVGILLPNSIEWEYSHLGVLVVGGIVVGLDVHDVATRLQYIAGHAELNVLIVQEQTQLEKFDPEFLKTCKFIVTVEDGAIREPGAPSCTLVTWESLWAPRDLPAPHPLPQPEDIATIIYTSGTTGTSKGIAYSHRQVLLACRAIIDAYQIVPGYRSFCWLPLSNLFQRITNLCALVSGGVSYILGDPFKVTQYTRTVHPDIFIGVPRFYEKLHAGIQKELASQPWLVRRIAQMAIAIGGRYARYQREGRKVSLALRALRMAADRLVLRKIRRVMGDRARFMISGSAPIPVRLLEFFHAIGLPIFEAYGLSENIVPVAVNRPDRFRLGAVGQPLAENVVKISPQGEVLVRGAGLFRGYHKSPEERACFTADDFYSTGDFGELDEDGFLHLKGRSSEIIKTAGGRRIAPFKIEAKLQEVPYIDQAVVLGQGRNRLIGILTFDEELFRAAAAQQEGVSTEFVYDALPESAHRKIVRDLERCVQSLSHYEQPAGFLVLRSKFSIQGGDLTSNLKIRRHAIATKYAALTDYFYQALGQAGRQGVVVSFVSSAMLRMAELHELPVLTSIKSSQPRRLAELAKAFAFVSRGYVRYRALAYWGGHEKRAANRDEFIQLVASIIKEVLAPLKGPLAKLGQMVSYMGNDIPEPVLAGLRLFQDTSPPLQGDIIRQMVERSLGKPIKELFAEWHDTPIAAASISQVHFARLKDGQPVAVKVRYPNIERIVKNDLRVLRVLLSFLSPFLVFSNFREVYNELYELVMDECDFLKEAEHQQSFSRIFADDPDIIIPEIFSEHSTSEVLTMEYVEGKKFAEFKASATQEEKNRAAEIIWKMSCISINRHCVFNADPHPGNYLFVDGKVCFLDFGFTKRFSPEFMHWWKLQSLAGCANDLQGFTEANIRLGIAQEGDNFDHGALLDTYRSVIYQAWREDERFRFSHDFVKQELKALFIDFPSRGRMPRDFCALTRLLSGQHAIMAELEAESNWHRVVIPLLREPIEPEADFDHDSPRMDAPNAGLGRDGAGVRSGLSGPGAEIGLMPNGLFVCGTTGGMGSDSGCA